MDVPEKIRLDDNGDILQADSFINDDKVITVTMEGQDFLITPLEAVDLMNKISGVLLAYGYSTRHN